MNRLKGWEGLLIVAFLLLTACAGSQNTRSPSVQTTTQPASSQSVLVTITDQKIVSSMTTFNVDTPYQFTVVNKGRAASNLVLLEHSLVPEGSPAAQEGTLYLVPSTQLPPGATRHFTYAFPNTTYQSNLELATDLPGITGTGRVLPIDTVLGRK